MVWRKSSRGCSFYRFGEERAGVRPVDGKDGATEGLEARRGRGTAHGVMAVLTGLMACKMGGRRMVWRWARLWRSTSLSPAEAGRGRAVGHVCGARGILQKRTEAKGGPGEVGGDGDVGVLCAG